MYSIQKDRNYLLVEYLSVKKIGLLSFLSSLSIFRSFFSRLSYPSLTRFSKRITFFISKYQLRSKNFD